MAKSTKQTGPLQNLFIDIQKILEVMEVKDQEAANEFETDETRANADLWIAATDKDDTYLTYKNWWTKSMFQEVKGNIKESEFQYYMENPLKVPFYYYDKLLEKGRAAFMETYEEQNNYYRAISGLPNVEDEDFIYLSDELCAEYGVSADTPVHKLTNHIQNLYMNTEEYENVVKNNPTKKYLLYLGDKKIDIYTARKAKDFEIIRYPVNRSDINPVLLKDFARLYKECREYVMVVLYNTQMADIYVNYRTFLGVLITSYALMRTMNTALEGVNTGRFMDDTILHIILSMYGIPDNMLMNNSTRRDLVANVKKLIREKGTKEVYQDIVQILGYQDVTISKLMLMKNQQFTPEGEATDEYVPVFAQVDINDDNPYNSIVTGKANIYSYHDIVDADPMWWDLPEVRDLLKNKQYTIADSKYITIEALIHQTKYVFESVYFTRMLLDNKSETDKFMIAIPELFGTTMVSVFDIILFVICATCLANGLTGEIVTDTDDLIAVAGFNFEAYNDEFNYYLSTTEYVDKDRLISFLSNLTISSEDDVNRVFNDTIYPLREWLEKKIVAAENRQEYVEYENIYRALFTYDITRNKFLDDFKMPIETILEKYNISTSDFNAFSCFYPNKDGRAVTVAEFNGNINTTKYHYPFISLNDRIDWNIHIITESGGVTDDRGYLYFWDVLNCEDVRELTNAAGLRIFMDYEDAEIGWELNQAAVDKAIELIDSLDDDMLVNAYFQIYTQSATASYTSKQSLPAIIKSSGMFKNILKEKILMDCQGLCALPKTYFESLYRKNKSLYDILMDGNRFDTDKQKWYDDISTIISAMESALSIHMKYFEQSIVGESMFFNPLIALINRFKSSLVDIAKTGVKYILDSKMDIGGNSNMLKLFDEMPSTVFNIKLVESIDDSNFGLFDTTVSTVHHIVMKDQYELYRMILGEGFLSEVREIKMGSVHLTDEILLYKNGVKIDDDEHQYEDPESIVYTRNAVRNNIDLDGWQDFVESYNSEE